MRWSLALVLMVCIPCVALAGSLSEPAVLVGVSDDCFILGDLLGGVSGAIARIANLPFEISRFTAFQMADLGLLCSLQMRRAVSHVHVENHIQDVFDRVGGLAVSLLRGQPLYVGLQSYATFGFAPSVWARIAYDDPDSLGFEYIDARPALLRTVEAFSETLDQALGEAVVPSWEGCVAVPTVGALIDLELELYCFALPWTLNEPDEWEAALLELLETDGASLFEAFQDEERLIIVTPEGYFGTDDFWRLYFSIPSTSYLDVSTWRVYAQAW